MQSDVRYAQNFSANQADLDKPWLSQNNIWWLDLIVRPKNIDAAKAALDTTFRRLILADAETIGEILLQENRIGARYFSTVGMHLVAGRDFDGRENAASKVAIVNEAMTRRYFPNKPAIGQRFGSPNADTEIIGVVQDARVNAVRDEPVAMAYYPIEPPAVPASLEVRTTADPHLIETELRKALLEGDQNLPIDRITALSDQVNSNMNPDRLIAGLTSAFGALALGLACFGLYGVMSYAVARRRPELGVRMALGASRTSVLWMILRESLLLVCGGLAFGLALVFLARRLLSALLFGITANDPATIVLASFLLASIAVAAACVPAWRASRLDPVAALRDE
jgi:predicted permease